MKFLFKKAAVIALIVAFSMCTTTDENLVDPQVNAAELVFEKDNSFDTKSVPIKGQYIVTLKEGVLPSPTTFTKGLANSRQNYLNHIDRTLRNLKAKAKGADGFKFDTEKIQSVFNFAFDGFVVNLTDEEVAELLKDKRVKSIEQDRLVTLAPPPGKGPGNGGGGGDGGGGGSNSQQVPYGIARVGGFADGTGKTAWVIDSGIDLDHPDLVVDVARSISFTGDNDPNDGNGHGTHVAGTIAAVDNSIGVVGVAAGASVVSVKVLGNDGSGQFSWTVQALDYVAAVGNVGDVANMSLGPSSRFTDSATDNATAGLGATGVRVTIAAGNSYDDCAFYSPARTNHPNVFTISGIGEQDVIYWSSNYGSPVDYAAPGVDVLSTVPGGYDTFSGTSMAAPHAAGVILLGSYTSDGVRLGGYFQTKGRRLTGNYSPTNIYGSKSVYRDDPDGVDDPIIVRN